jgi:hypothetical protein
VNSTYKEILLSNTRFSDVPNARSARWLNSCALVALSAHGSQHLRLKKHVSMYLYYSHQVEIFPEGLLLLETRISAKNLQHPILLYIEAYRGRWGKMIHRTRWHPIQITYRILFTLLPCLYWKQFMFSWVCVFFSFFADLSALDYGLDDWGFESR